MTAEKQEMTKLTVDVPSNEYYYNTQNLLHGQLTHIIRAYLRVLRDNKKAIFAFTFGNEPLVLPAQGDYDASNGTPSP